MRASGKRPLRQRPPADEPPGGTAGADVQNWWPEELSGTWSWRMVNCAFTLQIFNLIAKLANKRLDVMAPQIVAVMVATIWTTACAVLKPVVRGVFSEHIVCAVLAQILGPHFTIVKMTYDIIGAFSNILKRRMRVEVKSAAVTLAGKGRIGFHFKFSWRQRVAIYLGLIDVVAILLWNAPACRAEIFFLPAAVFLVDSGVWHAHDWEQGSLHEDEEVEEETDEEAEEEGDEGVEEDRDDCRGERFDKARGEGERKVREVYSIKSSKFYDQALDKRPRHEILDAAHTHLMSAVEQRFKGKRMARVTLDFTP